MSPQEAQMEDDNLTEASGKSIVTPEKQDDTDSDEQNHAKVTQETYQTDEDQEVQTEASVSEDSMKIVAVTPEKQDGLVDSSDRDDIKLRHASYQDEEAGDYYAEDDHAEDSVETIAVEQQDGVDGDDNIKLMHDSNQTDEERRRIRKTQRLLYTKVVEAGDDLNIDEVRGENNKIFSNVYYPREAVLDGANMKAIVTRAAQKVDRIFKVRSSKSVTLFCIYFMLTIYSTIPRFLATMRTDSLASWWQSAEVLMGSLIGTRSGLKLAHVTMPCLRIFLF